MDLSTTYMGMKLRSPLVPSAGPYTQEIASIRQLEDAGAGAVVLWSLFEEQVEHEARELEHYLQYGADRFAESLSYFPEPQEFHSSKDEYLEHISKAKAAVDIPVIASLNGVSAGGWISIAQEMAEAGADALELNVYFIPTDPGLTAEKVEDVYVSILQAVKSHVSVPVAMKLSPFFSSTANMARKLTEAGADALVLFNRFYQPDIDVSTLSVQPNLQLSTSAENRLPLRWMAILHGNVDASLAATTGIHTGEDVGKMLLAGADVAMMCSAILTNGIGHVASALEDLSSLMDARGYESVAEVIGAMSQRNVAEPAAFERANYMKALTSFGRTQTFE